MAQVTVCKQELPLESGCPPAPPWPPPAEPVVNCGPEARGAGPGYPGPGQRWLCPPHSHPAKDGHSSFSRQRHHRRGLGVLAPPPRPCCEPRSPGWRQARSWGWDQAISSPGARGPGTTGGAEHSWTEAAGHGARREGRRGPAVRPVPVWPQSPPSASASARAACFIYCLNTRQRLCPFSFGTCGGNGLLF